MANKKINTEQKKETGKKLSKKETAKTTTQNTKTENKEQMRKTANKNTKKKNITKNKNIKEKKDILKEDKTSKEISKEQAKIETIRKELKSKNKIPIKDMNKIYNAIFPNIYIAAGVIIYFLFMIFGFYNINNKVFITDVKAFSIAMLCGAIAIFEYAYKKDSTKFAIYGIESLVMAILTMSLIYINLMYFDKFAYVVAIIAFALAAYYIVKCVVIYKINKKKYFMNQMREIIDKDEENE